MKSLVQYIQEKLIIKKSTTKKSKIVDYNYFPQTKKELQDIILKRIEEEGNAVDLNDIDVSNITDMSYLFADLDFNGDIPSWDVSNVTNMNCMFSNCRYFNQDISKWDVSNVETMERMFEFSEFNGNISKWNVSKVKNMSDIFYKSPLEKNPPKWYKE